MSIIFLEYPKCSTCRKAKHWLDEKKIDYIDRDITIQNPKKEELTQWLKMGNFPIKRLFNTSGLMYKELNLKEKLEELSEDEQLTLLASHGMLVKRPLIIADNFILAGFKEDKWEDAFKL